MNKSPILIENGKNKYKILSGDKYFIDTNTSRGEAADFYWIKPYGGKKWVRKLGEINEENQLTLDEYQDFDYHKREWQNDFTKIPKSLIEFLKKESIQLI